MALAVRTVEATASSIVYCRISAEDSDGGGVQRQLSDCLELAQRRGWTVDAGDIYRDDGFSASRRARKRRPQFEAMLQRIASGGVARVLVWNVDRLYRDPRDLLRLTDLTQRRVEVVTVLGGDLDLNSDDGTMRAGIMAFVAQREADAVSTRVRRQKRQRRELGLPHGGRLPFGWRDLMTPEPAEAALLREAMTAVVAGASLYDLADRWTAAGVRRRMGATPFSGVDIKHLLIAPRHAGLVVENGEIAVDGEGVAIEAKWPAIVPRDLWEACRSVLAARATGVGVPRRRSWLTGVLRCGACGVAMTSSSSGGRAIWRCWKGRGGCGLVSVGATPVERLIEEGLFAYVDGPELRSALATRDDGKVTTIRHELAAVDRQLRALIDEFRDGGSARALRMATDGLEADRRRLEAELGRASASSPLQAFTDEAGALQAAWPAMTTDQRRAVILAAFGAVTVARAASRGRRFDPTRVTFGSSL